MDDFAVRFDASPIALTPVFLVLATPEWVAALEEQLTAFRATARVLAEGPTDLRRYFVPAETIPPDQRAGIEIRMVSWLRDHPDVMAALAPYFAEA